MSQSIRLLFYGLWITPHIFQIAILIVLMRRQFYSHFPLFAAYTAFAILNFVTLFAVSRIVGPSASGVEKYIFWYSIGLAIYRALQFGVIWEVFARLFERYPSLQSLEKPFFRWTTVALLAVAFCLAIYTERNAADPTWFTVYVLDRSASLVQTGLVVCLFVFAAYLNVSWPRPVFGIALGLGILCSVELASTAIRSQIGRSAHVAIDLATMGTYLGCTLIWLFYLVVPEAKPPFPPHELPKHELELWNRELERLLTR